MPKDNLRSYLLLHSIVFIWGFTAILGKLISIDALPLVWYRMGLASLIIYAYIRFKGFSLRVSTKTFLILIIAGMTIALHWVTFFMAIKVSNVSIALATMSTGALFTAFLEPIWYGRKFILYELLFGILVILGLYMIYNVNSEYGFGILLALVSALLGAVFTLINGQLIKKHKPATISFYELSSGGLFITLLLGFQGAFNAEFFALSGTDWIYLLILASICTAFAFIAAVKIMRFVSPYTVMLTINMEPVYGILMAYFIFGESEKMNVYFYLGALVILITVVANGILKNKGAKEAP
ncbi:DMT family transporter [Lentiprolixibacter aurantiacus]|uniref:DMT family transporter n=1 Tax=Lentiprolixibacter aurantiacus TaxID=2993939 RepID=A0AAE3MLP8_9FLAO|nr:DMT family transporter [Lentiprolixibacter aurantiacus]MCX2720080.1 DMT family transporter [Lentiprolixibacter aurantiacus]